VDETKFDRGVIWFDLLAWGSPNTENDQLFRNKQKRNQLQLTPLGIE
jgi:hypothetical protein